MVDRMILRLLLFLKWEERARGSQIFRKEKGRGMYVTSFGSQGMEFSPEEKIAILLLPL